MPDGNAFTAALGAGKPRRTRVGESAGAGGDQVKLVLLSTRIPSDLAQRAKVHVAQTEGETIQTLVASALTAYLDKAGK